MTKINCLCCGAAALLLASCSVHPLPEQAEGSKTTDIVTKIRCEARRAIEDVAIERLRYTRVPSDSDLATRLQNDRDSGDVFELKYVEDVLHKGTRERIFYDDYINSGIAFNFTFDITESNHNDSEFDFGKLVGTGTGILAVKANADLDREGVRHFIVSDTFKGLLQDPRLNIATARYPTSCPSRYPDPNIVFPVTGDIGLNEVVKTFVGLNTDEQLLGVTSDSKLTTEAPLQNPAPAKPLKASKSKSSKTASASKGSDDAAHNVPVLADTLTFTSKFEGSVNPTVTLLPGKTAGLTKATFLGDHIRTDKNTVIIGLSYKPIGNATAAVRPFFFSGFGPLGSGSTATVFAHRTNDTAEDRAINATIEQQYNTFVQSRTFGN